MKMVPPSLHGKAGNAELELDKGSDGNTFLEEYLIRRLVDTYPLFERYT